MVEKKLKINCKRISVMVILNISLFANNIAQIKVQELGLIEVRVDLTREKGPIKPIWAFFGHDEPNYTYMKDGKKLLTEISLLSNVPVFVRVHNLLNTGDGTPNLKWGSSNVYTEDAKGNPIYDWTIIDKIFDTYVERGIKPLAQISFMPKALAKYPEPYQRVWNPANVARGDPSGWASPPKDYERFASLIYEWVKHSIDRYGKEEVESWLWEVWNEPNGVYFRGTTEEYIKLYDYCADAIRRALPSAKVGGPHSTGPGSASAAKFLRDFLDHIVGGENFVTGKTGAPLDFIAFHAKGLPILVNGVVQMNMGKQLRDINKGFEIVSSYPELKKLPVIIGESDPEGCAACSEEFSPQNAYRNGTLYSSYTAASFARKYDLAEAWGVNLIGAVTWAFEFEDKPYFAGFRDLATNGIDKPVLNVFRMFGMMQGVRVGATSGTDYNYLTIRDSSVRGKEPDINALAAKDEKSATVMVWNYHDDNIIQPASPVSVKIRGITADKVLLHHYRIDQEFSNSYEVWKKMGRPQKPTQEQYKELEKAGQLQLLTSPEWIITKDGEVIIDFQLPRQGVSLLKISW
jgi:xylan 1,4-beta-xylosidase